MNPFRLVMKKKFIKGISWLLLLVMMSTNNMIVNNSLTAYAQGVSSNSSVTGESQNSFTEKSTESTVDETTGSGSEAGETGSDENGKEDDNPDNNLENTEDTDLNEMDGKENELPEMEANDIISLDTYVGVEKSDLLKNFIATLKQDDIIIDVSSGEKLNSKKDVDVSVSFDFPVIGDEGIDKDDTTKYIKGGDYATIDFPVDFSLVNLVTADLKFNGTTVGTLTLDDAADGSGGTKRVAKVLFLDTINDPTINTASANFSMTLKYDGENDGEEAVDKTVYIYDKTVQITIPPKSTTVTTEKTGIADASNRKITWKVKINADKEGGTAEDGNLKGYSFSDDLTNVGIYKTGSFKITADEDGINPIGGGSGYS